MAMDGQERRLIEDLFAKLQAVEDRGDTPRDAPAETLIADFVRRQPAAPYYMAQAILVQEHALKIAQDRIAELEETASRPSVGGFLGGLFGGGSPTRAPSYGRGGYGDEAGARRMGGMGPGGMTGAGRPGMGFGPGMGGGGFLAGAAQTAMGVAGGMLLGSLVADMFTGTEAMAHDLGVDATPEDLPPEDQGVEDGGGFFDEEI
jgi:hypothetical protein